MEVGCGGWVWKGTTFPTLPTFLPHPLTDYLTTTSLLTTNVYLDRDVVTVEADLGGEVELRDHEIQDAIGALVVHEETSRREGTQAGGGDGGCGCGCEGMVAGVGVGVGVGAREWWW